MRPLLIVLLYVGVAHADGIGANAAIGAGGQGDATYSGIELGVGVGVALVDVVVRAGGERSFCMMPRSRPYRGGLYP